VTIAHCTRCNTLVSVRLADVFSDCGWNLPYRLCAPCYAHYQTLDSTGAALFAQDLWQRAAVQSARRRGSHDHFNLQEIPMRKLDQLRGQLAEARATIEPAAAILGRAQKLAAAKAEALRALEAQHEAAVAAQSSRLAEDIAAGEPPDCALDSELASALASARHEARIATGAVSALQKAHVERCSAVQSAQAAIVAEVDALLNDEITERALGIARHLDEVVRLGTALKFFCVAAGINSTAGVSAPVQRTLARLDVPLLDMAEIPVNVQKLGDIAAYRDWTDRRSQMIAGTDDHEPESAAA
jgi:hypothetical protein